MDITSLAQVIQAVGFPIVCCAALFWKMNEDQKSHREEAEKTTSALNGLNVTLQRLCDKMEEK